MGAGSDFSMIDEPSERLIDGLTGPFNISITDIAEAILKISSGSEILQRIRVSEPASQYLFIAAVDVVR